MQNKSHNKAPSTTSIDLLWDLWCIVSIIGIWPRWIEPNILFTNQLSLPIPHLPPALKGFKILQFSDLHLHKGVSDYFLNKLSAKIQTLNPDLIAFTGDILCYSQFRDKKRLHDFLNTIAAPYGCYAIFGNHDYAQTVSINNNGDYDICESSSSISRGLRRLFSTIKLSKVITPQAQAVEVNKELVDFFKTTPFELLDNQTKTISVHNTGLNITGVGEYSASKCKPENAFKNYDPRYPGITLLHNPDGFPSLKNYPGNIVLSGHTHGGQVNLPFLWKKFTLLENIQFKKGLFYFYDKWFYVSRGVGSIFPFRWCAPPEIVLITLEPAP